MAITVTEDLSKGAKIRVTTQGVTTQRLFLVEGLDPADPFNTNIAMGQSGIPQYLDGHPAVVGVYAIDITAEPQRDSRCNVIVTTIYGSPEITGGSLNTITVTVQGSNGLKRISRYPAGSTPGGNLDGEVILIGYNPRAGGNFPIITPIDPNGLNGDPAQNGGTSYDYAQFEMLSPNTVASFHRWIISAAGNGPLTQSQSYRRRTNSQTWQGGAAGTWLCRQFDSTAIGSSRGLNTLFEQTISFEYDPDGWDQVAYFRNALDGQPPPGISIKDGSNNGYIRASYARTDFSQLKLPAIY